MTIFNLLPHCYRVMPFLPTHISEISFITVGRTCCCFSLSIELAFFFFLASRRNKNRPKKLKLKWGKGKKTLSILFTKKFIFKMKKKISHRGIQVVIMLYRFCFSFISRQICTSVCNSLYTTHSPLYIYIYIIINFVF